MKTFLANIFFALVRPLLGTNISQYIPGSQMMYRWFFQAVQTKEVETVPFFDQKFQISVYAKDASVGAYVRLHGQYEPTTMKFFADQINPGDTVFDVGGNIGLFSVVAADKVGEKGHVFSFEPMPENATLLKQNIDQNGLSEQNTLLSVAVGDHEGEVSLEGEAENKGGWQISEAKKDSVLKVPLVTLDQVAKEHNVKRIDVMKTDIEGAELMALRGAKDIISKSPGMKMFFECNPEALSAFGGDEQQLLTLLKELELEPQLMFDEHSQQTLPYSETELKKFLDKQGYINLLAVKK